MAAAWRGWRLLIHPVPRGIAVHRATARVDDLPQFRQLWQQRRQAMEAVDEGVAVAVGIHLAISLRPEAEHGAAALPQGVPQLHGVCGVAQLHPIGQGAELLQPFAAGGGQRQLQLGASWLQPLRQSESHVAAANDRQVHGGDGCWGDPKETDRSMPSRT